jgi:exonuclease III
MGTENILIWNVRGLNANCRRDVVRDLVVSEQPSIVCLEETKRIVFSDYGVMQLLRRGFDYLYLPAIHNRGGILLAWRSSCWSVYLQPVVFARGAHAPGH